MNYWLVKSKLTKKGTVVIAETSYHAIQKVIYTSAFLGHKPSDFKTKKL
jgi:hypothetical protein